MKNLSLIRLSLVAVPLLLIASLSSVCQIVELRVDNPIVRIGDAIEVKVSLKGEEMEAEFPISSEEFKALQANNRGSGSLTFSHIATDTGSVTFGPFHFMINGEKYTSDIITVQVHPAIPEMQEGVWIKQIGEGEEHILVIEQTLLNAEPSASESTSLYDRTFNTNVDDPFSTVIEEENSQYVDINMESIDAEGLSLKRFSTSTSTKPANPEDIFSSEKITYRKTTYKIKKLDSFSGEFKLLRKHLVNYPDDLDFTEIIIR